MTLENLGLTQEIIKHFKLQIDELDFLGRVVVEHKERYTVQTSKGVYNAEITGAIRYSAADRRDFPIVGDWVKIQEMDESHAIIIHLYKRYSLLQRKLVGSTSEVQPLAANLDYALIAQAFGQNENLNRLDRYLTLCHTSKIEPIIVLTKADLVSSSERNQHINAIKERHKNIDIICVSNEHKMGFDALIKYMIPRKTYGIFGSSGVGKSTIVNILLGTESFVTNTVSSSNLKGKHTTSHRELVVLPNKSIIIDTPGMREVGITDTKESLDTTFDQIAILAKECRFKDCTHQNELGCAVQEAINNGTLSDKIFQSFLKLKKEAAFVSASAFEKRQKNKDLTKLYKRVQSQRRNDKY